MPRPPQPSAWEGTPENVSSRLAPRTRASNGGSNVVWTRSALNRCHAKRADGIRPFLVSASSGRSWSGRRPLVPFVGIEFAFGNSFRRGRIRFGCGWTGRAHRGVPLPIIEKLDRKVGGDIGFDKQPHRTAVARPPEWAGVVVWLPAIELAERLCRSRKPSGAPWREEGHGASGAKSTPKSVSLSKENLNSV